MAGTLGEEPGQCCTPGVLGHLQTARWGTRDPGGWRQIRGALNKAHRGACSLSFRWGPGSCLLPGEQHSLAALLCQMQHPTCLGPCKGVCSLQGGPCESLTQILLVAPCSSQEKARLLRVPLLPPQPSPHHFALHLQAQGPCTNLFPPELLSWGFPVTLQDSTGCHLLQEAFLDFPCTCPFLPIALELK